MQENIEPTGPVVGPRAVAGSGSYVEWGAVLAGSVAALAVSSVLLTFGAAVGLAAVSPWSQSSKAIAAVGLGSAFWILLVALWSFALAGYLSARLRHRWSDGVKSEVEFRDKAHGLLAWAAAVTVAAIVATVSALPSGRSGAIADNSLTATAVDAIVRSTRANVLPADESLRGEVARAFTSNLKNTSLPDVDRAYLAGLVEARGGLAAPDATKRVNDAFIALKTATDKARKAGVVMGFLAAATLLIGAATAWWAAGVGGVHRDDGTLWYAFGRGPTAAEAMRFGRG